MKGLKSLLPHVTKEVYFNYLVVSGEDLSQIVKASSNLERLSFVVSKILTSDSLDFSSTSQSKLEYLSFNACAYHNWCNMEWDKYPDRFEKIVVAIKNSSLKDSLKTLNVRKCKISSSKVGEQLAAHGLSHINLGEEDNDPLSE